MNKELIHLRIVQARPLLEEALERQSEMLGSRPLQFYVVSLATCCSFSTR